MRSVRADSKPTKLEYDKRHDAAYFAFSPADSGRQVKVDNARIVDYGADGTVVGVEFLSPSRGIDLTDVPHAAQIEKAARRAGLPIRRRSHRLSSRDSIECGSGSPQRRDDVLIRSKGAGKPTLRRWAT